MKTRNTEVPAHFEVDLQIQIASLPAAIAN
jgi:hypothetical protein